MRTASRLNYYEEALIIRRKLFLDKHGDFYGCCNFVYLPDSRLARCISWLAIIHFFGHLSVNKCFINETQLVL